MRKRDASKKSVIVEYINEYYSDYGQTPTVRAISEETGIAVATVHRYLLALKELGEFDYNGRNSITTERIDQEAIHHAAPVLGYVACGEGQEEVEEVIEYIRLPESLVQAAEGSFYIQAIPRIRKCIRQRSQPRITLDALRSVINIIRRRYR